MGRPLSFIALTLVFCLTLPLRASESDPTQVPPEAALKELSWFEIEPFKSDPYIAEAARIQKLGEGRADYLRHLAGEPRNREPMVILCRMLFQARRGSQFRAPGVGADWLLGSDGGFFGGLSERTSGDRWPLYPIAVSDGVPFCIVKYNGGGFPYPEAADAYLSYCLRECDWSKTQYRPVSFREKRRALRRLIGKKTWGRPLAENEKALLAAQIE